MHRQCGDCSECCTGILEFQDVSAKGETIIASTSMNCTKYCNGCTIYADRPNTCRGFQCYWLADQGLPEWLKPNKCGFILYQQEDIQNGNAPEIRLCQIKDGVDIDDRAWTFALWWALTTTDMPVIAETRKYGFLKFR